MTSGYHLYPERWIKSQRYMGNEGHSTTKPWPIQLLQCHEKWLANVWKIEEEEY